MNFHRYYQPGQIVFITQVVESRSPSFADPSIVSILRMTWRNVRELHPFNLLAYVILPDHFHFLIKPNSDTGFSQIMHSIKMNFTIAYKKQMNISGSYTFWQKRFWDHVIRNETDLENHIHYIHFNPVKHGYVTDSQHWENSSFHEWVKRGAYQSIIT
ncbi:MAG TPA: transposase [Anaerolineaceae bacterium]|nr:transposase [Anaerolineaceae bacterium]